MRANLVFWRTRFNHFNAAVEIGQARRGVGLMIWLWQIRAFGHSALSWLVWILLEALYWRFSLFRFSPLRDKSIYECCWIFHISRFFRGLFNFSSSLENRRDAKLITSWGADPYLNMADDDYDGKDKSGTRWAWHAHSPLGNLWLIFAWFAWLAWLFNLGNPESIKSLYQFSAFSKGVRRMRVGKLWGLGDR